MAVAAIVEDGKIVESDTQNSLKNSSKLNKSGMDKESFLQLLVAQMQYQDPLEPTSNTEFISQYAQFSQVEGISNMATNMDLQRASSLVGRQVYVKAADSQGNISLKPGKVDYVIYENGKAYLSIEEKMYSLDDLDTVVDDNYFEAFNMAYDFVATMNMLPSVNGVDLSDGEAIDKLEKTYNEMNDYQKTFIAKDKVDALNKYIEKIKELRTLAEQEKGDDDTTGGDDDDTVGGDDETNKTK